MHIYKKHLQVKYNCRHFLFIFFLLLTLIWLDSVLKTAYSSDLVDDNTKKLAGVPIQDVYLPNKLMLPIKLEARIDVPLELNLEKALNIAQEQNLNILQSKYEKDIYKWRFLENIGNWFPDYSLGINGQRFDGQFLIGGVLPIMALTSNVNAFMRFDYRFFEGGKGFFNTLASRKLYNSSKENLLASHKDVFLIVTKAYNFLLQEGAKLIVLSKAVEEAQAELKLNQDLENQGVGTRFDVLQSEAQLAEQEQEYISQQSKFREASIILARLLNLEQGVHIKPDQNDLDPKSLFDIDKPINEIISLAIESRPEIKKSELEYKAKRYYIGSAFSAFLPKANFFGQYGGTGNVFFHRTKRRTVIPDAIGLDENGDPLVQSVKRRAKFQTFDPLVDVSEITSVSNVIRGAGAPFGSTIDDSLMTSKFIGVQVGWEVGNGLGVPAFSKIHQAKNEAKAAKTSIEIVKQNIEQEVRTAYLNVQTTKKLIEVTKKRVIASTEALRLAKVRLENGIGINIELLNAQKQHKEALVSEISAIVDYSNAQAELLHALGIISIENLLGDKS